MSDTYVLDASAVLAFLRDEPGWRRVEELLGDAIISTVNLAEVASRLSDLGMSPENVTIALTELLDLSVAFDAPQALEAGHLRSLTRNKGLSLGDRACIALARTVGGIALTADRAWAELDIGVGIELIR